MYHSRLLKRLIVIVFGAAWFFPILSIASEPGYDKTYSRGFEEFTGYELSEEGVRSAMGELDSLRFDIAQAVLAVVGEQKYVVLTDRLKEIYAYGPEDAPNEELAHRYEAKMFRDQFRKHVVRSLILCGDPEAEKYATELALESPEMELVAGAHAIRSLKYLVRETDADVNDTILFLVDTCQEAMKGRHVAAIAARELVEIEKYLQATDNPKAASCSQALDVLYATATSPVRKEIQIRRAQKPSWNQTRVILRDKGEL